MASSTMTNEVITPKSLYTITGAAAAVWLFGAVLFTVLGERIDEVIYRSIAFGISLVIAVGMLIEKKTFGLKHWLLIIPNSALIFVNASGYNAVNTGSFDAPGVVRQKDNPANSASIPYREMDAAQKASILPFLKDIAWWPDPTLDQKIDQLENINDSLVRENKSIKQMASGNSEGSSGSTADKQKIAFLEDQVKLLKQENNALKAGNNNTDLTNAIAGLKKELGDKTTRLTNCNDDLQKTKKELTTVTNQLNSCLAKPNSNDALNARITSLTNQLAQAKKELDACESKLKNCENKPGDPDGSPLVMSLRKRVSELEKDVDNLKGQLNKCQADLKNNPTSGDQSKQIYELQKDLSSYKAELEKCSSDLRRYQGYYKTCTGQLGSVRDSLNRCLYPKQIIKTQIPKGN